MFYIGEESGTEYEENVLTIFNLEQLKVDNLLYDDIFINTHVRNFIRNFIEIKKEFYSYLEKKGELILQSLIKNKIKINELFKTYSIKTEDLIPINVYINKEYKNSIIENVELKSFNFIITIVELSEILKIISQFDKNVDNKIIFIVDPSTKSFNDYQKAVYNYDKSNLK